MVVIIGILASFGIVNYTATKERALDKIAQANLKLIAAAEKIYRMETGSYNPTSGTESDVTNINSNLRLSLTETIWDYVCDTDNTQATATRAGRIWTLGYTSTTEPTCSGCP